MPSHTFANIAPVFFSSVAVAAPSHCSATQTYAAVTSAAVATQPARISMPVTIALTIAAVWRARDASRASGEPGSRARTAAARRRRGELQREPLAPRQRHDADAEPVNQRSSFVP
jgi:hypothetical protein